MAQLFKLRKYANIYREMNFISQFQSSPDEDWLWMFASLYGAPLTTNKSSQIPRKIHTRRGIRRGGRSSPSLPPKNYEGKRTETQLCRRYVDDREMSLRSFPFRGASWARATPFAIHLTYRFMWCNAMRWISQSTTDKKMFLVAASRFSMAESSWFIKITETL